MKKHPGSQMVTVLDDLQHIIQVSNAFSLQLTIVTHSTVWQDMVKMCCGDPVEVPAGPAVKRLRLDSFTFIPGPNKILKDLKNKLEWLILEKTLHVTLQDRVSEKILTSFSLLVVFPPLKEAFGKQGFQCLWWKRSQFPNRMLTLKSQSSSHSQRLITGNRLNSSSHVGVLIFYI